MRHPARARPLALALGVAVAPNAWFVAVPRVDTATLPAVPAYRSARSPAGLPGQPPARRPSAVRAAGAVPTFRAVAPGLEQLTGRLGAGDWFVLRVDPRVRQIALHAVADPVRQSASLQEYASEASALAGLSGGYLRSYYPPIPSGYVSVAGRDLSPVSTDPVLNALVRIQGGDASFDIVPLSRPATARHGLSQLQTGPLLVLGGSAVAGNQTGAAAPIWNGPPRQRAFVAVDVRGRVLLGWTSPMRLPDVAALLAAPSAGFQARAAVAVSGDVNSGVVLRRGATYTSRGDVSTALHNVFLVR